MKVKGLRWWVLGLIVLVTIINYLDRNTLGIMWAKIVEDLGLINTEGLSEAEYNDLSKKLFRDINMVFMIFYGLSQLFSGKLYDKIGTRRKPLERAQKCREFRAFSGPDGESHDIFGTKFRTKLE